MLALEAGCAQGGDSLRFTVRNGLVGRTEAPGQGKALVQVFRRTVEEKTLAESLKALSDATARAEQTSQSAGLP